MTTWQGFDLTPAHRRWRFWIERGRDELPTVRSSSEVVPFRRGLLHKPGLGGTRRLEVRGYIQEADLAGLLATRDEIKRLLDPEADVLGILADTFEDGSVRWIRAIPRTADATYAGEARRLYSIELEALDPYWYGAWGTLALDGGYTLDDGWSLDASAEVVVVPASTAQAVLIDTLGSADVERVTLRLTGPSTTAPGFETALPDGSVAGFVMAGPLAAGEELVVDNFARVATVGGVTVRNELSLRAGNRNGEYLRLLAHMNTCRVLGQPAEARIHFTPTYQ